MPITPEIEMVHPKRTIGRPRSLSRKNQERVLSLSKAGLGSRSITRELQNAGVDVSQPTVQRALAKKGAYVYRMQRVAKRVSRTDRDFRLLVRSPWLACPEILSMKVTWCLRPQKIRAR